MNWLPRRTVVVPIDFSDGSFAALATASEMVGDSGNLHVVHVLPHMEPMDPGVIWQTIDDDDRSQHAEQALRKELDERKCDGAEISIRFGDPGYEITQFAEQLDAGLVIVASHGQTALQHLLIGSVAERVVRLAHCPVLVLKK